MTAPRLLSVEEVLEIHQDQIDRYGGTLGVRDIGLLQSAVSAPAATFGGEYLNKGLFEMAAAYLFHLVQNHAFLDGNKRVGTAAALVFLELNDVSMREDEEGLVGLTLGVATGDRDRAEIVRFLESHAEAFLD